jgi:hypothetical protein
MFLCSEYFLIIFFISIDFSVVVGRFTVIVLSFFNEKSNSRVLLKTGFSILDISGAIFFDHSGCIQV